MTDSYPTLTHSPTLAGTKSLEPNIMESQYLGGFSARSQNGRRATIKTFSVVQPIVSQAEYQTFEAFFEAHVAESFLFDDLDFDNTGATTIEVYFEGQMTLSTGTGRKFVNFNLKEK